MRALCVASLQEYKGHAVLLEALAAPELERVELDLVGDGPLRAELEARAGALGLAGQVRFHGSMREDSVRELFDRADLFVLPSVVARDGQMEGVPVVLMEALAAGVPVVATRTVRDPGAGARRRDGPPRRAARPGGAARSAGAGRDRWLRARPGCGARDGRARVRRGRHARRVSGS